LKFRTNIPAKSASRALHGHWAPALGHLLFACILLVPAFVYEASAQSRKELESTRLKLIEEINRTNRKLKETRQSKAATLDRYLALKAQVTRRQQLVATMQQEIEQADSAIGRSEAVLVALDSDIERLRMEYGRIMRTAYRLHLQQSWMMFILSSDSFNRVFRRRQYMRQYERYRIRQAGAIKETLQTLAVKLEQLERRKAEKQKLLTSVVRQSEILRIEMEDKNTTLKSLKADESNLVKALEKQEREREAFNAAIERIIREETAQKKRQSRTSAGVATGAKDKAKPIEKPNEADREALSGFGATRGKLEWPVSGGRIVKNFGPQPHPTLKGVTVPNNGVDIGVETGAEVKAVYDGQVVSVQFVVGHQNMVIVQHGIFYTVYSNLSTLSVRRGDAIATGQVLGVLGSEALHFQVWQEKKLLNPAGWLK
jgi:septal ring factor EnvC (AmiA/AmiB activator)